MAERKVSKLSSDTGVSFTFSDGAILEANLENLSEEMVRKLAIHGLSQKIGDAYSGEEASNCQTIAETTYKSLVDGSWSSRSGGGGPKISQLSEALARVTGEDIQDCVAKIAEMDDEGKKDLRAHPHIKSLIATIQLEKAQAAAAKAEAAAADGVDEGTVDLGALMS